MESSRPKPGRMEETPKGGRDPPWAVALLERERERERREREILGKYSKMKFHENPPIGSRNFFYADRRKDGYDEADRRFSQFC